MNINNITRMNVNTLELAVEKDSNPNFWIVSFFGNLDTLGLKERKKDLLSLAETVDKQYLVYNFTNLNFINSEAISFLLQVDEILRKNGRKLVVIEAKRNVIDVLEVIGIFETISYYKTLADFLKQLENA